LVASWNGTIQEFKLGASGFEVITRVTNLDSSNLTAPPTEGEGLIAITYKRGVIRVWGSDGSEKWTRDLGEAMSAPPLIVRASESQVLLIVGAEDGTVRAFDVETQEQAWEYKFGAAVQVEPALWPDQGVIVGASNGEVVLLDLGSGAAKQTWAVQGSVRTPVVVDAANNRAFVRANGIWVLGRVQ
jgi:outer membrane protein assembly factor BamB